VSTVWSSTIWETSIIYYLSI